MESNSICNHMSEWLSDNWEAVLSMITDRIGQHKVLLPINHNCYNFWKKNTFRTNILEKMCNVKNSSSVEISHFFFNMVVAMVIVINSAINFNGFGWMDLHVVRFAASTVRLQVSDYSQQSEYRMTSEK